MCSSSVKVPEQDNFTVCRFPAVMFPSHICRDRVTSPSRQSRVRVTNTFFKSSQSHKNFESEASQSRLKFFESSQGRVMTCPSRVRIEPQELLSHWFASSSQCRFKWNSTYFLCLFCYKMVPNHLQNYAQRAKICAQCCFTNVGSRLIRSTFLVKAL